MMFKGSFKGIYFCTGLIENLQKSWGVTIKGSRSHEGSRFPGWKWEISVPKVEKYYFRSIRDAIWEVDILSRKYSGWKLVPGFFYLKNIGTRFGKSNFSRQVSGGKRDALIIRVRITNGMTPSPMNQKGGMKALTARDIFNHFLSCVIDRD